MSDEINWRINRLDIVVKDWPEFGDNNPQCVYEDLFTLVLDLRKRVQELEDRLSGIVE